MDIPCGKRFVQVVCLVVCLYEDVCSGYLGIFFLGLLKFVCACVYYSRMLAACHLFHVCPVLYVIFFPFLMLFFVLGGRVCMLSFYHFCITFFRICIWTIASALVMLPFLPVALYLHCHSNPDFGLPSCSSGLVKCLESTFPSGCKYSTLVAYPRPAISTILRLATPQFLRFHLRL